MPPPQPFTQTTHEHDFISLAVDDDVIHEMQPQRTKAKKGKKELNKLKKRQSGRRRAFLGHLISWNHLKKPNNRKREGSYNQVCVEFFKLIQREPYPLVHSISSKWREMNAKIGIFAGIYQKEWNNRPSGSNDEHILLAAIKRYTKGNNGPWQYMRVNEILKNCGKWKVLPNEVEQAKRSQRKIENKCVGSYSAGGFDARYAIDINDKPEFKDEAPTPESRRPVGRNRAKRERAKASGSKTTSSRMYQKLIQSRKIQPFHGSARRKVQKERERKKKKQCCSQGNDQSLIRYDSNLIFKIKKAKSSE